MAYLSAMPKGPDTIRKEVHLLPKVIEALEKQSKIEHRSIKNYMESILNEKAEQLSKPAPKKKP